MHPLILVPGTLCDSLLWKHQKTFLSNYTNIHIADISQDDSIELMAQRLLTNAPPKFALAGLSLGGIVAMEVMRQAPERVTKLALLDTNPHAPRQDQVETWEYQMDKVKSGGFEEVVKDQIFPAMFYKEQTQRDLFYIMRQMARNIGEKGFLNQLKANKNRPLGEEVLPYITCPTLVLAGRQDALCSEEMHQKIADLIPGAKLVFIEQCGHLSPLEQPEAVTSILSYWMQINEKTKI